MRLFLNAKVSMALFLSCFLLNLLNFMNISNCKKRCPFLVCKLQQDIFIFLSVYFFSCFELHVIVYFCSKKRLCFYLVFNMFLLLFIQQILPTASKDALQEMCLYWPHFYYCVFLLLLNSMNISNCCVSSKFPVLNLRPQNLPQQLFSNFTNFTKVFINW